MPATMTNTEFTAFLNTEATARTLANIARRASSLFTEEYGYTAFQSAVFPRLWAVTSPQGSTYTVRAASVVPGDEFLGDCCDCPAFPQYGTCKHLQAVLLHVEGEAAMIAEGEERERLRDLVEFDLYLYDR